MSANTTAISSQSLAQTPQPSIASQPEKPKQHYNGLLIVGIALLALGLLLVIATCCLGSALFDVSIVAISFSKAIETTTITLAGKLLLVGIIATVTGTILTIIGNSKQ